MVSPWELLALFVVLPVVAAGMWLNNRFETDGAPEPAFEAWLKATRPLLVAVRCSPEHTANLAAALLATLGPERRVQHFSGRHPWTRYVFAIRVEADVERGVVRAHAEHAAIRLLRQTFPDLGAAVQRFSAAGDFEALWLHTELRDGDETRGEARRGRGWLAKVDNRVVGEFELTAEPPAWALEGAERYKRLLTPVP